MGTADLDRFNSAKLAEFTSFNREVAALIRSGLPLEIGLGSRELSSLSSRIGSHLQAGRTFSEALESESKSIPPSYRAVVEAGLESGDLPAVLDRLARIAQTISTLRRRMALATVYPAFLVLCAVALTLSVISQLVASIEQQFLAMHEAPPAFVGFILWLVSENPLGWIYWLPALALVALWGMGGTRFLTLRMPGVGPALRYFRLSVFADLACSLLDNDRPLERALPLAAAACGDRRLAREAGEVARRLKAGEPPKEALRSFRSLPSFAKWMLVAGAAQNSLPATLDHLARWAYRRGDRNTLWFASFAPVALSLFLGIFTVIIVATISFGPVIALLEQMAKVGSV